MSRVSRAEVPSAFPNSFSTPVAPVIWGLAWNLNPGRPNFRDQNLLTDDKARDDEAPPTAKPDAGNYFITVRVKVVPSVVGSSMLGAAARPQIRTCMTACMPLTY
jgi:hypothetical protein